MKIDTKQLNIPLPIREIVEDRDGELCRICGSHNNLQIHHIVPRSQGVTHDLCNLVLICEVCHRLVEAGKLPFWMAPDESKLHHLNPVNAYTHYFNYELIKCKVHNVLLCTEFEKEPIMAYQSREAVLNC